MEFVRQRMKQGEPVNIHQFGTSLPVEPPDVIGRERALPADTTSHCKSRVGGGAGPGYSIRMARKSFTLVSVGPVIRRSSILANAL